MFGYITVDRRQLSPKERECYQAGYCGVCHALQQRYGARARLLLSFDMSFVALLLSALYEESAGSREEQRCPLHPLKTRPRQRNAFVDYGADMSLLLRYYSFLDQWRDEGKQGARRMAAGLSRQLPRLETLYPRQFRAAADYVQQLSALEASGRSELEEAANLTGQMMAEILCFREDIWAPLLRRLGFFLGKFIYIMDAYEDLERDRKKASYNPLLLLSEQVDFEDRCQEILGDMLAEASRAFEQLPIVDQPEQPLASLLRKVLYSGVWMRYGQIHRLRCRKKQRQQA
ncbi:MAG: DUF5685 family protein [Bacillota bacterium]|nr:DUF5685 family protein [Bacillota bacterium]